VTLVSSILPGESAVVEKQKFQSSDGTEFLINGFTFDAPIVPVLLQILNGANASELVPSGSIYALEGNKSVEISIPAGAPGGPVSYMKSKSLRLDSDAILLNP
jgi:iron transport multicopper oxidase